MEKIKKNDFVEINYVGYTDGKVFDSNLKDELEKIHSEAKPRKVVVCVGKRMLIAGLDEALEEKEIGKEYNVQIKSDKAFGPRRRELMKTIPLKVFTEKRIRPQPGMVLAMDETLAKVIAVSGARVIMDFNSPLAGKDLEYKFTIVRKVEDVKEKSESMFENYFRFVPEFEVKDKVIVKGPKVLEKFIMQMNVLFKETVGKELAFEEKKQEQVKAENKN